MTFTHDILRALEMIHPLSSVVNGAERVALRVRIKTGAAYARVKVRSSSGEDLCTIKGADFSTFRHAPGEFIRVLSAEMEAFNAAVTVRKESIRQIDVEIDNLINYVRLTCVAKSDSNDAGFRLMLSIREMNQIALSDARELKIRECISAMFKPTVVGDVSRDA